jgi:hypothetical protein
VEAKLERNKMHQFQKHFDDMPKEIKELFNTYKGNREKKAQIVNSVVQAGYSRTNTQTIAYQYMLNTRTPV